MRQKKSTNGARLARLRRTMLWGLGGAADNFLYNGLNVLIFPIFNIGLGVNAVLLGVLSTVPRLLDAVTDPLMGHLSDKTRTRVGRRRPYILVGSILSGALFFLLFLPSRAWSESAVVFYYLPLLIAFYLAYTVFVIPYTALGFELTRDPAARVKVLAWRNYLGLIAGLAVPFLYKACFWFGGDEVHGVKWVAALVAVFTGLTGVAIFAGVPEEAPEEKEQVSLLQALKMTFGNRQFLFLSGTTLTMLFGLFIAMPLIVYINNFYIFSADRSAAATWFAWNGSARMAGGFIGAVTVAHLPFSRFATVRILLLITMISIVTSWWTFSPVLPWIQVPAGFLWGFGINGIILLCGSFLADICDVEAMKTGHERQGFYAASQGFLTKCAISLSTVASGFAIWFAGVDGIETLENPTRLRLIFIVILGGSLLLSYWFYRCFERSARKDIERMVEQKAVARQTLEVEQ